jgi:hypothetical protein
MRTPDLYTKQTYRPKTERHFFPFHSRELENSLTSSPESLSFSPLNLCRFVKKMKINKTDHPKIKTTPSKFGPPSANKTNHQKIPNKINHRKKKPKYKQFRHPQPRRTKNCKNLTLLEETNQPTKNQTKPQKCMAAAVPAYHSRGGSRSCGLKMFFPQ